MVAKHTPAAAAVPKTPKAAEPVAAVAPDASETSDSAPPEEGNAHGLLTAAQLHAFAEAATAGERLALLSTALRVNHYDANPRSLVWTDFCFGVLTFALEEAQLGEPKALALLNVANEVFGFATSPSHTPVDDQAMAPTIQQSMPLSFPTTDAVYDVFKQLVRANSVAATASLSAVESPVEPTLWNASDVARIVAFMSSTFFRHLAAYQYALQFPRECLEREVAVVVESPLPPPPLAAATAMSQE